MKKIISLLFLMSLITLPALAELTTDEAISPQYVHIHGYSSEMARLIDLENSQINGANSKYKRPQPEWYSSNKAVSFVRKVFIYFDPALDDEKFMQHEIYYTQKYDDL